MKKIVAMLLVLLTSASFSVNNFTVTAASFQKKIKKDSVGDLNKQRSPHTLKNRRKRDQMQLAQKILHEKQADSIRKVQEEYDKHLPDN